jgi:tetrahydromethanopterin S-methyltransferase subunit E
VIDDFEVGRADRDRVDAHQHFGALRHRHRLLLERELAGITVPPAGFSDAVVRAGTSRTFVVTPTFTCGVSSPRSIHGDVVIVDAAGRRTSLSTTTALW